MQFDGITEARTRTVGLDIADALRFHISVVPCGEQEVPLRLGIRCGESDGATILVNRATLHDGVDWVTCVQRIPEPLQHEDDDAFTETGAIRPCIEGTDPTGW